MTSQLYLELPCAILVHSFIDVYYYFEIILLIALNKAKEGDLPDVMPIAVGETLCRLTGKCICSFLRDKFSSFFQPSQFGIRAENIIHSLRKWIEENWLSGDFVAFKVDMSNAFNLVSKQAVLDDCATFFPEILPWVSWCYGFQSMLWHLMGKIRSESVVQQGDPLGPMSFGLVLHRLVTTIAADDDCLLLLEARYLDDRVLTGDRSAVPRALHLIEVLGPGLHINFQKCELFSRSCNTLFPMVVKSFLKCAFKTLLEALVDVSAIDLHVAFSLLRMCGGFCKLVHHHIANALTP